jgi:hypothetical protein
MPELTEDMFSRSGLDPDEYVGYRCETAFPVWRLGYRMKFDYSAT